MDDTSLVNCPYCLEEVDLYIDPQTQGSFVEDCSVCCRPWQVYASRDEHGQVTVVVGRAQ